MHNLEHEDRCLLYESGELLPAQRGDFERESASCPACGLFLEALRRNSRLARKAACYPAEALNEGILQAISGGKASTPAPELSRRTMALAFAAFLLALMAFGRAQRRNALQWTSGLERDLAVVSEDIESLSIVLSSEMPEQGPSGFDAELDDLEQSVDLLRQQTL